MEDVRVQDLQSLTMGHEEEEEEEIIISARPQWQ